MMVFRFNMNSCAKNWLGLSLLLISSIFLSSCSDAQTLKSAAIVSNNKSELKAIDFTPQIEELRRSLQNLKQQIVASDNSQSNLLVQLSTRMSKLESEKRDLLGTIEELQHNLLLANQKLERQNVDAGFRIEKLEKQLAAIPSGEIISGQIALQVQAQMQSLQSSLAAGITAAGVGAGVGQNSDSSTGGKTNPSMDNKQFATTNKTAANDKSTDKTSDKNDKSTDRSKEKTNDKGNDRTAEKIPDRNQPAALTKSDLAAEKKLLDAALNDFKRGKYEKAQATLEGFLEDRPGSPNSPEVLFWLGETYYSTRRFEKAASTFFLIYEKYPRAERTAESLYRLGVTLYQLKRKNESCAALIQVASDYPKSNKALLAKVQSAHDRYKCK